MKKWISVLAIALLAFAFASCLNLGDDSDYVQDWMCMATVTTGGAHPIFQLDEGTFLAPENTMPADTFEVGERYFLHFILGDTLNHAANTYPVNFYRYGKTTVKNMIELPKDSADIWENQPISGLYAWFSGHYFNTFFISYAGSSTPNTYEFVRIMDDENTTPTDTVPKLYFELRHNVATYASSMSFYRFYSFDLDSLKTDFPNASKYTIQVKWKSVEYGIRSFSLNYTPELLPSSPNFLSKYSLTPF